MRRTHPTLARVHNLCPPRFAFTPLYQSGRTRLNNFVSIPENCCLSASEMDDIIFYFDNYFSRSQTLFGNACLDALRQVFPHPAIVRAASWLIELMSGTNPKIEYIPL